MKKKLILVAEFFAVCAVAGGLIAAAGIDPNGNGVTAKEAVSAVVSGAVGALYIGVRLLIPFAVTTLSEAKDALIKQITGTP